MKKLIQPALIPAITGLAVNITIFEITMTIVSVANIAVYRIMAYVNIFFTSMFSALIYVLLLYTSWRIVEYFIKNAQWDIFVGCARNLLIGMAFFEAARLLLAVLFLSGETPGLTMKTLQEVPWFTYQKWLTYAFSPIFGLLLTWLLVKRMNVPLYAALVSALIPFGIFMVLVLIKL
jgi:hypothetical protein